MKIFWWWWWRPIVPGRTPESRARRGALMFVAVLVVTGLIVGIGMLANQGERVPTPEPYWVERAAPYEEPSERHTSP